jgi:hypothetical protein
MHHSPLPRWRYSLAALALIATACVDAPVSPTSSIAPSAAVLGALANKPPLDLSLEGQAWVCKDGNSTGTFPFSVSIDGGTAVNYNIPVGQCVMVHSVSRQAFGITSTVSATEGTLPANWTLGTITVESNVSNTNAYMPVINSPTASGRIANDFGIVITFTNTFTPPPPRENCTLTQGYWKNHGEDWDQVSDGKPFLTTSTFYNSGVSYLTILNTPPKGGNAYLQLAHQFIAASLNLNGGTSANASVNAAISGAATYFAGAPAGIPNPVDPTRSQLQGWATTLDNYNNGLIGPGHCED